MGEDGLFVRTQSTAGAFYVLCCVYNAAGVEDPDRLRSLQSRHQEGAQRGGGGRGGRSRGSHRRDRPGSNFEPVLTQKRKVSYVLDLVCFKFIVGHGLSCVRF